MKLLSSQVRRLLPPCTSYLCFLLALNPQSHYEGKRWLAFKFTVKPSGALGRDMPVHVWNVVITALFESQGTAAVEKSQTAFSLTFWDVPGYPTAFTLSSDPLSPIRLSRFKVNLLSYATIAIIHVLFLQTLWRRTVRAHLWEYAWLVIFPCTFTLDKIVKLDLHFLIKDIYRYPNLLASIHLPAS